MTQSTLLIEGWKVGFNKVAVTKILQLELGLSLSSAKDMTDRLLEGKQVALSVPEEHPNRFSEAAENLGAKIHRNSVTAEDSCR